MSDIKRTQSKEWLDLEFGRNNPSPSQKPQRTLSGVGFGQFGWGSRSNTYHGEHQSRLTTSLSVYVYISPPVLRRVALPKIVDHLGRDLGACKKSGLNLHLPDYDDRIMQLRVCAPHVVFEKLNYRRETFARELFEKPLPPGFEVDSGATLLELIKTIRATQDQQSRVGSDYSYHLCVLADGMEVYNEGNLKRFHQEISQRSRQPITVFGIVVPTGNKDGRMNDRAKRAQDFLKGLGATIERPESFSLAKRFYLR